MASFKSTSFPSYVLYGDDVFIFCMANKSTLTNLVQLLYTYVMALRPWPNHTKSHYYTVDKLSIKEYMSCLVVIKAPLLLITCPFLLCGCSQNSFI